MNIPSTTTAFDWSEEALPVPARRASNRLWVSALVMVLAGAGAVALTRRGKTAQALTVSPGIKVLNRWPLGGRQSLCVVQIGGRHLLLGVAEGSVTLLTELAASDVPAPPVPAAASFADLLSKVLPRHEK